MLGQYHANPIPRRLRPLRDVIAWADIVHVLGYREPVSAFATAISWRRGVPYLIEPFGSYGRRSRSLRMKAIYDLVARRTVVPNAAGIIATSQLEAERLVAEDIDRDRIFVRPNGLAFHSASDLSDEGAFRRRLGIPQHARLVLCISRLARTKGLQVLMRAMAQPKLREAWCVIAGPDYKDGTLPSLLELRRRLGLEARVLILEKGIWDADKWAALRDADGFCLPSPSESFGFAALEAAASGIPVVVSEGCGGREWLPPESTRVFAVGSELDLSRALDEVLAGDIAVAAANAAAEFRRRLDWDHVAQAQLEIYESVLAGMPQRSRKIDHD